MQTSSIRIEAVDIYRALIMFTMLFVNDICGTGMTNIPDWLNHAGADKDMLGLSDIVFPGFIFVMGMAIPFAIENRLKKGDSITQVAQHILYRAMILLILGAFTGNRNMFGCTTIGINKQWFEILMVMSFFFIWNAYPKNVSLKRKQIYKGLQIVGVMTLILLAITFRSSKGAYFHTTSTDILGHLGWVYLVVSIIYIFLRDSIRKHGIAWCILVVLAIFSATEVGKQTDIMSYIPGRPSCHLTLNSIGYAGMIISLIMSRYANRDRPARFIFQSFCISASMLILFFASHHFFNIRTCSISWMFLNLSIFPISLGIMYWISDVRGYGRYFNIIKPAGTATLTCYIIPYFWYSFNHMFDITYWGFTDSYSGIIKGLLYSFAVIGIAWALSKRNIRLKI